MVETKRATPGPEADPDYVHFTWLTDWVSRHQYANPMLVMIVGALVAVVLALWLTSGAWGGRPPAGDDSLAHVVRAQFAVDNVFSRGRLDGWQPSFILGYQEFLFIGPGFTVAVALLHWLTFGLLSVTGAVKVVAIGAFVATPLAVAFLARSLELDRRAAGAAAILSLAVNNPFGGVGLQGLFGVGLLTHSFAAVFFFVSLGAVLRLIREPGRRWTVFTAVAVAALLVSHGISVMIFGAVLGVMLVTLTVFVPSLSSPKDKIRATIRSEIRRQLLEFGVLKEPAERPSDPAAPPVSLDQRPSDEAELNRWGVLTKRARNHLVLAFVVAGALAACVLVPFARHSNLRGTTSGWGTPPFGERVLQIWRGELLFQRGIAPLVVAGLVYGFFRIRKNQPYAMVLMVTAVAYLPMAHVFRHMWPESVVTPQLTTRGLGYVAVLAILPLAALLARITWDLGVLGDLALLAAAAGIVIVPIGTYRDLARQSPEPIPQLREAARQLAEIVPDGARFATERDFPAEIGRTKVSNPDRWLAWASGRYTLNNFNVESSQTPGAAYESEHILDRAPEAVADGISRLGTTHLVTVSDQASVRMAGSPRFTEVWQEAPIAIFSVVPRAGQPDPASLLATNSPADAGLVVSKPEHLVIEVAAAQPSRATVAVGWSPKWHATVNGRSAPLFKSSDGLLELSLPAGESRVDLEFRRDMWDYLGLLISVATALGGGWWLLRERRSTKSSS